ncbi:MAG: SAM-dependent chlorinase/fluorinase [Phycisphaerales bacterium]|nr:MAG: SAM-dependent chlorinase/fluorinase [Phycisphaerales bacterium]
MIVLLTDFGNGEYVGVMKGVIYSIHGDAKIVDLCHDISPQNTIEGSWILRNNYKYFPKGSVFCCVVDPGVGTERRALGVKTVDYYFIAPDNGLLWETLREQRIIEMRVIPIPKGAARTFHGRDVFAGAAANVDLGRFESLGERTEGIERLEFYQDSTVGTVVRIDRFGNVITNLAKQNKTDYSVRIGNRDFRMSFHTIYDTAEEDELFLIEGSCNTLEISLKNGSANEKLRLQAGMKIEIS